MSVPLCVGEFESQKGVGRVSVHVGRQIDLNRVGVWITWRVGADCYNLEHVEDEGATWVQHDEGAYRSPFLHLDEEAARGILAGFWSAGVRTKESMESGAHRSAIEGHLSDMRELVAHFAKVQLPGTKGGGA